MKNWPERWEVYAGCRVSALEGITDEGYIALGAGIGNIRSIKSVAEVVNELAIC